MKLLLAPCSTLSTTPRLSPAPPHRPLSSLRSLQPPLRRTRIPKRNTRMTDGADACIEKSMPRPDASTTTRTTLAAAKKNSSEAVVTPPPPGSKMNTVLFIETGFGCDGHGQDSTKAAVRAARNSIEFNSIPSIRRLVPGGYENLKLHVKIGVPHPEKVEKQQVAKVFPYGEAEVEVVEGGLSAGSGIAIASLGDTSDEMVIAVCAVTVGFFDADKEAKKEMKEKEGEKEGEGCGGGDAPKHAGYCE